MSFLEALAVFLGLVPTSVPAPPPAPLLSVSRQLKSDS